MYARQMVMSGFWPWGFILTSSPLELRAKLPLPSRAVYQSIPGTFSVWEVKMRGRPPQVFEVVGVPEAVLLNGVITNPWVKNEVLIADSS